ncbi:MAG: CBS domain-containing protein [Lewinellaceae bacterium]|nr:CBS domain-containing protein [Lewinellaceae bacterium]
MGEQKVDLIRDDTKMRLFMQALLNDVKALSYMLENDLFENDITRIGAEQEMVLIENRTLKPAPVAMEVLEALEHYPWMSTELAKFNLEINLDPRKLEGKCLSEMLTEGRDRLQIIQQELAKHGASLILTGILPTLRKFDLEMSNLTPKPRYYALINAINKQLMASDYQVRLEGIDELLLKHDSPLIEACNTSFQVHLQVSAHQFVKMYNLSQALAGPVLAIAANSPIVFGKRLWHESRIAMFQQALDTRSSHLHLRERSARVHFGNSWLNNSILDIYQEDIARFRVLLGSDIEEDALAVLQEGKIPKLKALQVHNSTVYRWNRPCYGISDNGKPHLRIENRVFPSGPTVLDEVANMALWLGAMCGYGEHILDVRQLLTFEDTRDNFEKAAKFGIDTKFNWFGDNKIAATDLILQEILPVAEEGLKLHHVDQGDIDLYLGIIRERAKSHMNGARWALRSFTRLIKETSKDEALTVLTNAMKEHISQGGPVHEWPLADLKDLKDYQPVNLKVSEIMTTDLFTVQKDDLIRLVAEMMDWRKVRYMPVEDEKGRLVGLVTSRLLLRFYTQLSNPLANTLSTVEDIMIKDPITVSPDAKVMDAMQIMKENRIGCLPVTIHDELVGIITEMDFLRMSTRLLERLSSISGEARTNAEE